MDKREQSKLPWLKKKKSWSLLAPLPNFESSRANLLFGAAEQILFLCAAEQIFYLCSRANLFECSRAKRFWEQPKNQKPSPIHNFFHFFYLPFTVRYMERFISWHDFQKIIYIFHLQWWRRFSFYGTSIYRKCHFLFQRMVLRAINRNEDFVLLSNKRLYE